MGKRQPFQICIHLHQALFWDCTA